MVHTWRGCRDISHCAWSPEIEAFSIFIHIHAVNDTRCRSAALFRLNAETLENEDDDDVLEFRQVTSVFVL